LLQWVRAGAAIALVLQTAIFWWRHLVLDEAEFMAYDPDEEDEAISGMSEKAHQG
jgi:POT family proton-dependent oligopeptide transporter